MIWILRIRTCRGGGGEREGEGETTSSGVTRCKKSYDTSETMKLKLGLHKTVQLATGLVDTETVSLEKDAM